MPSDLMLNLLYWFLRKPSGPATIMAPTALVPWMWLLSYTSIRLGGCGSPSVVTRPCSKRPWVAVSASLRPSASRALVSACATSSFFSPRRGVETSTLKPALIESASARSSHSSIWCDSRMSFGGGRFVRARKIGAVAPVLPGAKEEYLDAGISAFLMDGEHVGLLHGARIDALLRLDRRQRREAVAVKCRGLKGEFGRGIFHFARQLLLHQMAAAGQEILGFAHQVGIAGKIDLAGARPRTAADLIEQAGPGAARKKPVGAGADQKSALQRRDGAIDRARRGERPEIRSGPRLRAAMLEDMRRPMIARDQDIGKRLVVAQLHVEARTQLLDQVGFEQQRLGFGRSGYDLDRHGGRDHAHDARRLRRGDPGVRRKPLADVFRLADIEHVARRIEHAVDPGRGRGEAYRLLDCGVADRQRAFRYGLATRFRDFGQQRLVVVLGGGRGGVDIGGCGVLRLGTALRRPRAGCLRVLGGLLIHRTELKRRGRASPASRRRHPVATRGARMIRQSVSGLAIKIMRYLNNLERDRTQNRIPLLLIA